MMFRRTLLCTLLAIVISIPTMAALWGGWVHCGDNFHVVQAGVFYRSGQLSARALNQALKQNGILTVINLRGAHSGEPWYDDEVEVTKAAGAQYYNVRLSAQRVPSFETVQELQKLLRTAPRPILVHCQGGADRSGLAAALFESYVLEKPVDEAAEQLSFYYGHFPWLWSRSAAMDEALYIYAGLSSNVLAAR